MRWVIDGNNVFGSRPDGWWNDRPAAQRRFTQRVAEWCRTHDDDVTLVFDAPVSPETRQLAGGNLTIVEATRRGRDAADDEIVALVEQLAEADVPVGDVHDGDVPDGDVHDAEVAVRVVTSDKGLRERLPATAALVGVGSFRDLVRY